MKVIDQYIVTTEDRLTALLLETLEGNFYLYLNSNLIDISSKRALTLIEKSRDDINNSNRNKS